MDIMLQVKEVSKRYGEVVALEKVSLEIKKGELLFLVGPSGSGKTTLQRIITGELLPDEGEVWWEGKSIHRLKEKELIAYRRQLGIIFQDFRLVPEKTVRENIETVLAVHGVPPGLWSQKIMATLGQVGLAGKENMFSAQLSGGEIQRVAVARAVITEPHLILADEPTGNLDWKIGWEIVKLLLDQRDHDTAVIIASHNTEIIHKAKGKRLELEHGKLKEMS